MGQSLSLPAQHSEHALHLVDVGDVVEAFNLGVLDLRDGQVAVKQRLLKKIGARRDSSNEHYRDVGSGNETNKASSIFSISDITQPCTCVEQLAMPCLV